MNLKSFIETYGDTFPYPITMVNQDLPDQPLVYVNKFFRDLTGYGNDEVLGKNCRFLQGGKTSSDEKKKLRDAISARLPFCQDMKNYTKSGELFYNRLVMIPFHHENQGYFLGLQHVISKELYKPQKVIPYNELVTRTINPLSIMLSHELVSAARFNNEFQFMIGQIQSFILGL